MSERDRMDAMTPSEQIEWIHGDAITLCEQRGKLPKLVYLVATLDRHELVGSMRSASGKRPESPDGDLWLATAAGTVEVVSDHNKPRGSTPNRCYRCPCGALFLDDSSRSGKCSGCMMEQVARQVHTIRTPVGDIPMIADPALKPGEFRFRGLPACQGCNEPAAASALDSAERCDECRVKAGLPRRGVKHGPGGRGTEGPCDADCPKCAAEADTKLAKIEQLAADLASKRVRIPSWFDRMLDEHYPRDENGKHYLPAPCPPPNWEKLTKTKPATPGFRWVDPAQEQSTTATFKATPVKVGARIDFKPRPDGFAQSAIDAAKAAMLAVVPKRFK